MLSRPTRRTSDDFPATPVPAKREPCTTPGCVRSALVSASVCRTHLVDILRAEGEVIPWEEGDFAGLSAAAIHIVRVAFEGVPEDQEPSTQMDMYALLPMDAEWAIAQASLDMLGTHMADRVRGHEALAPGGVHGEGAPATPRGGSGVH